MSGSFPFLDRVFAFLHHRLGIPDQRDITRSREELRQVMTSVRDLGDRTARLARQVDRLGRGIAEDRVLIRKVDRAVRRGRHTRAGAPAPRLRAAVPPVVDEEWWTLDRCPVCEHTGFEMVCEYNRFLVAATSPEPGFEIYNYCLCQACGVVFASRRPRGQRFRALLENFADNLGRATTRNPVLNPKPLSEEDRADIERRVAAGPFVSEHLEMSRRRWMPGLQTDRLATAEHVELLGSLLTLDRPAVLEIRSRTGAILAALRRLYGAEVFALAMFESQRHVVQSAYSIRADGLIDFEHFTIPYQKRFDLVIANHMLTHAVTPRRFLRTVHEHLAPGGHLYLFNEPDEAEFLDEGQSIFRVLNPFHLQTFNRKSLERILQACGFTPVFIAHRGDNFLCLASRKEDHEFEPIGTRELTERREAYALAREVAVSRLPGEEQERIHRL